MLYRFFFALMLLSAMAGYSTENLYKEYHFKKDPVDVVIVSHPKDKGTIDNCIGGIRKNGQNVRRVIVVSSERLTENAEWFDETNYPFSKDDIRMQIGHEDPKKLLNFSAAPTMPAGISSKC